MIVLTILGWLFTALFGALLLSMVLLKNWGAAAVLVLLIIAAAPVTSRLIRARFSIPWIALFKGGVIVVLLFVFFQLLSGSGESIYRDEETRLEAVRIYGEKMRQWPLPYEDLYFDSSYGKIHIITSGDNGKPPLVLLHASGVGSWSWKYNVEALSRKYRIFAIDTIGDIGLSEYTDLKKVMKTGEDQARLYREIFDFLSIEKADVVGASEGGFIASNLAAYIPGRIGKMVLLAPMGYSGAGKTVARITLTQLFPLERIQKSTFRWAFSDSEVLVRDLDEWFTLLMEGVAPKKVPPFSIAPEVREKIKNPVLFVFGENDRLVGDPERAKHYVSAMHDVSVRIVQAGHLMGGEIPEVVDEIILGYLAE